MRVLTPNVPRGFRQGQTIYNFLSWLRAEKGYAPEVNAEDSSMADPFYIEDDEFGHLYAEWKSQMHTHTRG